MEEFVFFIHINMAERSDEYAQGGGFLLSTESSSNYGIKGHSYDLDIV